MTIAGYLKAFPDAGPGLLVAVGPTPPASPTGPAPPGSSSGLWWDTNSGQLFVWTGSQWVAASCTCCGGGGGSAAGSAAVIIASMAPSNVGAGQLWWSTQDGQLYLWTGSEWVPASCCSPANQNYSTLINAADDTAAATAGVAVGRLYRNGSQVMVRVS